MLKIKNVSKQAVSSIIALTLVTTPVYGSVSFNDVKEGNWYKENVQKIANEGLINGYPDGSFKPNNTITVGEFLSICVKMTKDDSEDLEAKENESWITPIYEYAISKGLIKEEDEFENKLNQPINREDMAYIIVNGVEKKEGTLKILDKIENNIYDIEKISENRKEAVLKAYSNGILTGKGISFDPKGSATRAEAATIATRMLWDNYRVDVVVSEKPVESVEAVQAQARQLVSEIESNINAANVYNNHAPIFDNTYNDYKGEMNRNKDIANFRLDAYINGRIVSPATQEEIDSDIAYEKNGIEMADLMLYILEVMNDKKHGKPTICDTANITYNLNIEKNKINRYQTKSDLKVLEDLKEKSEVALYFNKQCYDFSQYWSWGDLTLNDKMKVYYKNY